MPIERFQLVEEFGEAVLTGNAALFVGAGLSRDAGLPGWEELLDPIRRRCDIPRHHDLPLVAEYIVNHPQGGVEALRGHILGALTQPRRKPALSHRLVARLRVPEVWTTNYDPLIETAMAAAGLDPALAVDEITIQAIASNHQRTVIKMHGSIGGSPPDWIVPPVITRTDYERYESTHQRMWTVLRASYLSRMMLFLGFSFTDPNVEILLRLARTLGTAAEDRHIAVIKRPDPAAGDEARLHELLMADLESSGVRVCEITEYGENTEILTQLLRRTRPERLFIAGSSARPTSTPEEDEEILGDWCSAIARLLDAETTWEITSLGGAAGWLTTRNVARLRRRIDGRYDPAGLTFHFREKEGKPPVQLQERVGTVIYHDKSRETLVSSLLDESRALLAVRGGQRTAEEIDWAVSRAVGVVPLACSGGAAHAYWAAHRDNPPDLGGRPTDPALWELLNSADSSAAADAAHKLLAQAMYRG